MSLPSNYRIVKVTNELNGETWYKPQKLHNVFVWRKFKFEERWFWTPSKICGYGGDINYWSYNSYQEAFNDLAKLTGKRTTEVVTQ